MVLNPSTTYYNHLFTVHTQIAIIPIGG